MSKLTLVIAVATTSIFNTFDAQALDSDDKNQSIQQPAQSLSIILDERPEKAKQRYKDRHPAETIEFFGIQPGMTVVEAMPGRGWYSKILIPYLGRDGTLIGADYSFDMWNKFDWMSEENLEKRRGWVKDWTNRAEGWRDDNSASISAFQLGSMPQYVEGRADVVLFIRALHNLAYFENDGDYMTAALRDAYKALKSGGIVGIVQHMAPETASNEWANGDKGYLKKSHVIASMKAAGFEYVDSSDVNINPKDKPTGDDIVWRLPPAYATSKDKPELKKKYMDIGESTRMTLTFKKPE